MSKELVLATGLLLGALGYAAMASYVWRHRTAAGSRPLFGVLVSVFLWTTFYALEVASDSVAKAELWAALKYLGVVGMPPFALAFALEYTGARPFRRRTVALLSVVPALAMASLILPWSRELIHYWDPALRAVGDLPGAVPTPENGPLFWPHAIYQYVIVGLAVAVAVIRLLRAGPAYRKQAYVAVLGAMLPVVTSIIWNAGLVPSIKDPMPFVFSVVAVALVWGFFRQELIDVMPVARDLVLEQMMDGVIVLDVHDRVVDANPAAAGLLGLRSAELKGRYLPDLLPATVALTAEIPVQSLLAGDPGHGDFVVPARAGGQARDVALSVTPLVVRSTPTGKVVLLHDVTERQEAQRKLHELLDEQTRVADTLQGSLRPPSLPQVPGLEMAVRFLPAGSVSGGQVSGDFYDVHRVLGGDWAFTVGDVSGKGVEAAVVTTMARYTVRTLSAEGRTPREVLEHLNRALLVDESSERFCTLAYGRLDGADLLRLSGMGGIGGVAGGAGRLVGEPFPGSEVLPDVTAPIDVLVPGVARRAQPEVCVHLTLVLGGHPRPLLRNRNGLVMPVGRPGTALGLLTRVDVEEVTIPLTSGDVLLLYTDGVTEARRGVDQFGEERLAAVLGSAAGGLRGRTGVTAARLVAEAVAERVLTEVTEWASRRDDVALLVLAVP